MTLSWSLLFKNKNDHAVTIAMQIQVNSPFRRPYSPIKLLYLSSLNAKAKIKERKKIELIEIKFDGKLINTYLNL